MHTDKGAYLLRTNCEETDPATPWRSLEQWMLSKGLGSCARKLIESVSTIKSMDVILPVERAGTRTNPRLRVVAKPESDVAQLLARLGIQIHRQSKLVENGVPKNA